ncbi:MAG: hypothetical protein R3C99_07350 [Pirellulaceae bacterium]
MLYVLDEPTIGLHPRGQHAVVKGAYKLRDLGNTLIVVEHDREVIEGCDAICDFGQRPGDWAAKLSPGSPSPSSDTAVVPSTGPYLTGKKSIRRPQQSTAGQGEREGKRKRDGKATGTAKTAPTPLDQVHSLRIINARHRNLRGIDVTIHSKHSRPSPRAPAAAAQSSLVNDVLYATLARTLHRAQV